MVWLFSSLFVTVQCRSFDATAPDGFAVYDNGWGSVFSKEFKAITSDGIRYRVREVKNEPKGDAVLWQQTLRKSLEKRGFRIINDSFLTTDQNKRANFIDSQLSAGGHDYLYFIAFIVDNDRIIVTEAGGKKESMEPYKTQLQKAVKSLKIQ